MTSKDCKQTNLSHYRFHRKRLLIIVFIENKERKLELIKYRVFFLHLKKS